MGLLSLRLESTWFGTLDEDQDVGRAGIGQGQGRGKGQAAAAAGAAAYPSPGGSCAGSADSEDWGQAGGGRRGPVQWDEEKAVLFIQVCVVGVYICSLFAYLSSPDALLSRTTKSADFSLRQHSEAWTG